MTSPETERREHPPRPGGTDDGYILVVAALLLVPLMLFAAFATDVGYWQAEAQRTQNAADAAALAGAALLPNSARAEAEARAAAARNGYIDATPNNNDDFDTGPLPQIQVRLPAPGRFEVSIKTAAPSFFGRMVLDSIVIERFSVSQFAPPPRLGNPSSALGTGSIPESNLGVPSDLNWLAINSYCADTERGDQYSAGYYNGIGDSTYSTCGDQEGKVKPKVIPNPNFDPDAYYFVVEAAPGSPPIDLAVFEPGVACTGNSFTASGDDTGPRLYWELYGPSLDQNHESYLAGATPFAVGLFGEFDCYDNAPLGDGWWPVANALPSPSANGGYYYLHLAARNPALPNLDPTDNYWDQNGINTFSLRANRQGDPKACFYSSADPDCPQIYALRSLPMYRLMGNTEDEFYLTRIDEAYAGATVTIEVYDAADGAQSIQFANPDGVSVPFQYRYADQSVLGLTDPGYLETGLAPNPDSCTWKGTANNPCIITQPYENFNDHALEFVIEIPDDYRCGGDCWWTVRYATEGIVGDRTNWSIRVDSDPIRIVE